MTKPKTREREKVIMACPKCKAEYEDMDGFGVMHCEKCGYCVHPSTTGNKCDTCGKQFSEESWEKEEIETIKRFVIGMLGQYGRRWEELTELQQATFNDDVDKLVNGIIHQLLAKQREGIFSELPSKSDPMSKDEILDQIEKVEAKLKTNEEVRR